MMRFSQRLPAMPSLMHRTSRPACAHDCTPAVSGKSSPIAARSGRASLPECVYRPTRSGKRTNSGSTPPATRLCPTRDQDASANRATSVTDMVPATTTTNTRSASRAARRSDGTCGGPCPGLRRHDRVRRAARETIASRGALHVRCVSRGISRRRRHHLSPASARSHCRRHRVETSHSGDSTRSNLSCERHFVDTSADHERGSTYRWRRVTELVDQHPKHVLLSRPRRRRDYGCVRPEASFACGVHTKPAQLERQDGQSTASTSATSGKRIAMARRVDALGESGDVAGATTRNSGAALRTSSRTRTRCASSSVTRVSRSAMRDRSCCA